MVTIFVVKQFWGNIKVRKIILLERNNDSANRKRSLQPFVLANISPYSIVVSFENGISDTSDREDEFRKT